MNIVAKECGMDLGESRQSLAGVNDFLRPYNRVGCAERTRSGFASEISTHGTAHRVLAGLARPSFTRLRARVKYRGLWMAVGRNPGRAVRRL